MKQLKIIFSIFLVTFLSLWLVNASTLEWIKALDKNEVEVVASPDVVFSSWKLDWELRIVKDLPVEESSKDPIDAKKMSLVLSEALQANSTYSIISVGLAEWTIEFSTTAMVIWAYTNPNLLNEAKIIEKVDVVTPTQLDVYFNYDIAEWMSDFKVLTELKIDSVASTWDNVLKVVLLDDLKPATPYILMLSDFKDNAWEDLSFDEMLYDFKTPNVFESELNDWNTNTWDEGETDVNNPTDENIEGNNQEWLEENKGEWNKDLEEVAQNTNKVPETGPTTWLLLLLTFVLASTFILMKTKKS